MAGDAALEAMLTEDLAAESGLATKAMFGGLAWLLDGNLLCAAHGDGMLVRVGRSREDWARHLPGVAPMTMRGQPMGGWVELARSSSGDEAVRRGLLDAALAFTKTLPAK